MNITKKYIRQNFRISFRRWQPLDLPYQVSQSMLTQAFAEHKEELQKYLYLGWNKQQIPGKRRKQPLFMFATGETRQEAKQNFKANNEKCWTVLPAK